jgi:hypothetical protein
MDSSKFSLKLFTKNPQVDVDAVVPVFHGFIQRQALAAHLLVDVADYKHVPTGPGILLISHEANLGIDLADNRPGLLYARKQRLSGDLASRIRETFAHTLRFAQLLEADPALNGAYAFATNDIHFRVLDRLHAPNTAETFTAVRPALETVLKQLTGGTNYSLEHHKDPKLPFEIRIQTQPSDVTTLLTRLGA